MFERWESLLWNHMNALKTEELTTILAYSTCVFIAMLVESL